MSLEEEQKNKLSSLSMKDDEINLTKRKLKDIEQRSNEVQAKKE